MRHSGFTLIENLVALMILSVVLLLTVRSFRDFIETRRLEGIAGEIAVDIEHARSDAVARNRPARLSFHRDTLGSCYIVHTGAADACTCSTATGSSCSDPAATIIKSVTVPVSGGILVEANVRSFLFDHGRGAVVPAGRVDVSANGKAVRHVVNIVGRTRTCSPGGRVHGYKSC